VLFLGAVQLLSLGILGEYTARIYDQTRQVPPYVVIEDTCVTTGASENHEPDVMRAGAVRPIAAPLPRSTGEILKVPTRTEVLSR